MPSQKPDPSRRRALWISAGVAGAAVSSLSLLGGQAGSQSAPQSDGSDSDHVTKSATRMPVVFVPHGGGPWPFVEVGFGAPAELDALATYLKALAAVPKVAPSALLVISAHWEEPVPTVMSAAHPPMLYDYHGFPKESYEITWPAPGQPQLASRVRDLLTEAGIDSAQDDRRGFDHGTFVPLKLAYPDANVPTVQLSLKRGLDPSEHLALGRALAPLRDEGVFIVGSGMTFHNLRAFGPRSKEPSEAFDAWLRETAQLPAAERDARLVNWASAPHARDVHPREEHLLPLMVVAGAAGADAARVPYNGTLMQLRISAYHFG